jgi:hypothetical protein
MSRLARAEGRDERVTAQTLRVEQVAISRVEGRLNEVGTVDGVGRVL